MTCPRLAHRIRLCTQTSLAPSFASVSPVACGRIARRRPTGIDYSKLATSHRSWPERTIIEVALGGTTQCSVYAMYTR